MRFILFLLLLFCFSAPAAEKIEAGPRHGRLIRLEKSSVEFLIENDRSVSLLFYDREMRARPPESQIVSIVAEPDGGKKSLSLIRKGDGMVSQGPIPAGDYYNIFVTAQESATAPPKTIRINVDLSICGGCKNAEYVCTCGQ